MAVSETTSRPVKGTLGKYFDEPGMDDTLRHYDSRFFKGVVEPADRVESLTDMIRAYLQFFHENGLETWIAHGTLLGWWWNGKILPWDWDLDTQVSSNTLVYLGEYLNQTVYNYTGSKPGSRRKRQYLLDVNPASQDRHRGDGQNVIDARWTDISNGIYTDITGISELNYDTEPGVLSDKNFHQYREADIYPLRQSICEGVPASIPFNYIGILAAEYGNASLWRITYENHSWNHELQKWVPLLS
ncbi:hypothetical protein TMEN_1671 [Trichophyton mentagrophytes]|uniref:LicD/FKTN/FKRP nucleotidyltransferase domain-containing protein n=1 Tax=Trichophyton interdigitale (strain MR816) TaxID=1215338 RepID=A0A059IZN0_TRIIM|nr:hypothetical protein H109_06978 [Trichophyton interdigitale MR816]GBF59713.1 hypothetical protein TMEN_1671 [Trichophyton mentagrophytes]